MVPDDVVTVDQDRLSGFDHRKDAVIVNTRAR